MLYWYAQIRGGRTLVAGFVDENLNDEIKTIPQRNLIDFLQTKHPAVELKINPNKGANITSKGNFLVGYALSSSKDSCGRTLSGVLIATEDEKSRSDFKDRVLKALEFFSRESELNFETNIKEELKNKIDGLTHESPINLFFQKKRNTLLIIAILIAIVLSAICDALFNQ